MINNYWNTIFVRKSIQIAHFQRKTKHHLILSRVLKTKPWLLCSPSAIRFLLPILLEILVLKSDFFHWISRWSFQFEGCLAMKTFLQVFFNFLSPLGFSVSATIVPSSLPQPWWRDNWKIFLYFLSSFLPCFPLWFSLSLSSLLVFHDSLLPLFHLPVFFQKKENCFAMSRELI